MLIIDSSTWRHSIPLDKWGLQDSEGLNTCLSVEANGWWSQGYILVLSDRHRAFLPFVPRRGQCPPALKVTFAQKASKMH